MYQRKQLINYINQNSKPKSVIRISLCRTAKRNPNDRFGINNDEWSFLIRERPLIKNGNIVFGFILSFISVLLKIGALMYLNINIPLLVTSFVIQVDPV